MEKDLTIDAGHALGETHHLIQVMIDPQDGDPTRMQFGHQILEQPHARPVDTGGGLVKNQQPWRRIQGLCQQDALPLPAGEGSEGAPA